MTFQKSLQCFKWQGVSPHPPPRWHCTNNTYGCSPREPCGRFHWGDSAVSRSWLQRLNELGSHDVNATLYTDLCSLIPKNNWIENYSTFIETRKMCGFLCGHRIILLLPLCSFCRYLLEHNIFYTSFCMILCSFMTYRGTQHEFM